MSLLHLCARAAGLCVALALASPASAHVTLDVPQAAIGGGYKAVFRVPHGCQGSATVALRVQIPEGVIGVKPQPKPGWQISTVSGDYQQAHGFYGGVRLRSGVTELAWRGGPLPDGYYDEFVFMGYLSDQLKPGSTLYFPVVQECEKGVMRWIDIPDATTPAADDHSDTPAVPLKLLPAATR
ncbi:YcnI family protein [Sinimarinibacterium sp. NLF-5-8]|uniref:YcnI family protein n=1 Tax=Sinimarinibacterium sp. NLF-5-8 TaxID=2698684 RepID=UPI00137BE56F|nr:YcnI family protein [Sinimarinibacterium sp. NLF-5-8]QHS10575.1 YcnI family protein [Sinimarinibacterium sp. NLF-5-8]